MKVSRERARISRITQPADVQPFAEVIEIDLRDITFAGIVDRRGGRVDGADGAGPITASRNRESSNARFQDEMQS